MTIPGELNDRTDEASQMAGACHLRRRTAWIGLRAASRCWRWSRWCWCPGLERRRRVARFAARARLCCTRGHATASYIGAEQLPRGPVRRGRQSRELPGRAGHARPRCRRASRSSSRRKWTRVPLAGLLLRRIGSEFVDRFNRHKGAMDARRVHRRGERGAVAGVLSRRHVLDPAGIAAVSYRRVRHGRRARTARSCRP